MLLLTPHTKAPLRERSDDYALIAMPLLRYNMPRAATSPLKFLPPLHGHISAPCCHISAYADMLIIRHYHCWSPPYAMFSMIRAAIISRLWFRDCFATAAMFTAASRPAPTMPPLRLLMLMPLSSPPLIPRCRRHTLISLVLRHADIFIATRRRHT